MQEAFEPDESVAVADDPVADGCAVVGPEPLAEGGLHLGVAVQLVDDRVARDRRRAVALEGGQRLALPRSDAARDRDG
jgi:hypothetical protein